MVCTERTTDLVLPDNCESQRTDVIVTRSVGLIGFFCVVLGVGSLLKTCLASAAIYATLAIIVNQG